MTSDPMDPIVRRATGADVASLGSLGALVVQEHHEFDQRRFLAARSRTPDDYASFLRSQLNDPEAVVFVADVIGYAFAALEGYDYMSLRGPPVLQDPIVHLGIAGGGGAAAAPHDPFISAGAWCATRRPLHRRAERVGAAAVRAYGVPTNDGRDDSRAERHP